MTEFPALRTGLFLMALAVFVTGCTVEQDYLVRDPDQRDTDISESELRERQQRQSSSVFGEDGFDIFNLGGNRKAPAGSGIAVNSFLWRASLDTISFMPLSSADPFGGVIITDWYSPPEAPNERYKMSVYILGRELRADGVKVSVFKQQAAANGWRSGPVAEDTALKLENQILTRARQLRLASADQ